MQFNIKSFILVNAYTISLKNFVALKLFLIYTYISQLSSNHFEGIYRRI